ncbi:Putative odorant-binding protein A10 [Gryllus bimaculatus]|nr:Putative odorant-binding protein A10 [Gryllus bimaculatus]
MSRLALSLLALALLALAARAAEPKYTNKFDNIDIDRILGNERVLTSYIRCMMEEGPCTNEGRELRNAEVSIPPLSVLKEKILYRKRLRSNAPTKNLTKQTYACLKPIIKVKTVAFSRPDMVLIDRDKKEAVLVDIALPLTRNLKKAKAEKITKYEDLDTGCTKCNEKQKTLAEKVIKHLTAARKADWERLAAKYDPEGLYKQRYAELLATVTPPSA